MLNREERKEIKTIGREYKRAYALKVLENKYKGRFLINGKFVNDVNGKYITVLNSF